MPLANKTVKYLRRKKKVNQKIKSSDFEYRFIVNRTNKYTYGHIIDKSWNTVVMMGDKWLKWATKTERAMLLGKEIAKKAMAKWVKKAVFDRNGFLYHGRIAALCNGAREEGLGL